MQHASPSIMSALVQWWRERGTRRAHIQELEQFSPHELGQLGKDTGASPTELRALAGKWPDSAALLTRRIKALHIPPAVAETRWSSVKDMKKLCSLCDEKQQCDHDLTFNADDPNWKNYCPNADTFDALIRDGKKPADKSNGG